MLQTTVLGMRVPSDAAAQRRAWQPPAAAAARGSPAAAAAPPTGRADALGRGGSARSTAPTSHPANSPAARSQPQAVEDPSQAVNRRLTVGPGRPLGRVAGSGPAHRQNRSADGATFVGGHPDRSQLASIHAYPPCRYAALVHVDVAGIGQQSIDGCMAMDEVRALPS